MRCIVKDCQNHEHQGEFIGSLCSPCHKYITKGEGRYSQAYRNTQRTWVGLTDEDCKGMSAGDKAVAMWADRTLKEKNT